MTRDVHISGLGDGDPTGNDIMLKTEVQRYQKIKKEEFQSLYDEGDLVALIAALDWPERFYFSADCCAHVLPLYYEHYTDPRPAYLLRLARLRLQDKATREEFNAAHAQAIEATKQAAGYARTAAYTTVTLFNPEKTVSLARKAMTQKHFKLAISESQWQMDRVMWYLTRLNTT